MSAPIFSIYLGSGGGGGSVLTVGTFDSQTPSSNGAVISGQSIYFQSASASDPGMVNTTTQTFAGAKTFSTSVTSPAFISSTANPASAGALRLAATDVINWRNAGNTANNILSNSGDALTYTRSVAGEDSTISAVNSDNTSGSSHAKVRTISGGASGGDAYYLCSVTGVTNWSFGLDNSSSDSFKISASAALGTSDRFIISTDGPIVAGGGIDTGKAFKIGAGSSAAASNGTTGTGQAGISSEFTCSSAATANLIGIYSSPTTVAAAFTCGLRSMFYADNNTKGAGSTITRDVAYFVNAPTQGSNNACIADNTAFSGNFFISSTNTNPSSLAGQMRVASLGVGNSAAATTPGTVTNKIEVFNASGVSLGFLAVYDAIS